MAAYFYSSRFNHDFICGGSLISKRLVITAAHCVEEPSEGGESRRPELSTFYLGKNNLESLIGEKDYISSTAKELIVHPHWKRSEKEYDNDIAIAVLVQMIEFNKYVKPICIWRKTNSYEDIINKQGVVAGWGKIDSDSISSKTAMFVKLPAVSNEKCLKSDREFQRILGENAFCGGELKINRGPCSGDSGAMKVFLHRKVIQFSCFQVVHFSLRITEKLI